MSIFEDRLLRLVIDETEKEMDEQHARYSRHEIEEMAEYKLEKFAEKFFEKHKEEIMSP